MTASTTLASRGEAPAPTRPRHAAPVTAAGTDRLGYKPALDGLRALAVLAVIAYHDGYSWARGGFLGVDTFFVLSGFLITALLVSEHRRRGAIAFGGFWARRARRLLPALLLVLCFVAAYNHLVVVPWERTGIRTDMLASLFYVANWRFILDQKGYFELFSAASPVRHMWSLAIEEQYYLVWPLVVAACLRLKGKALPVLAAVCGVGAVASVVSMQLRFVPGDPSRAYYATDSRAHTILIGALAALAFLSWRPSATARRVLRALTVPALGVVAVCWWTVSGTAAGYYRGGSALFAVLVAVLILGVLQPGPLSALLSWKPLVWIGRISYGLYLWHWPIDVWLAPSRLHMGTAGTNAVRLALTFAAAIASYHQVEWPVRNRIRTGRATLGVAVPSVAVVVALIAYSTAGATAPPSYIWGFGDPLICGTPRPAETREAQGAQAQAGPLALPQSVRSERLLLVGDSTACSLWPGFQAVASASGIPADKGSVFGCGVASDQITTTRNEAITPHTKRCHQMVDSTEQAALAKARPTVVVWMSSWEKSDLVVDGRTVVAGTPPWEREIQARMDAALTRLTAGGARVVLLTVAAPAPNPAQATQTTDPKADDAGYVKLTALLRRFQARHRDKVTLVDLASKVCPGGPPCPADVEGLHARPDGRHLTPAAATWAARWLMPRLFPAS